MIVWRQKLIGTPEGRPLGGLPSKNEASDFEEGESQKAVFSQKALIIAGIMFLTLGAIIHFVFDQNLIYTLIY